MPLLEIHLQKGFELDDVIVRVNGNEVVEYLAVTTNTLTGLAKVIRADAPEGPVTVRLAVPSRGIVEDVHVDATRTPFVGVGLAQSGERLETRLTAEPFDYPRQ
jgi:hypothetical protein